MVGDLDDEEEGEFADVLAVGVFKITEDMEYASGCEIMEHALRGDFLHL